MCEKVASNAYRIHGGLGFMNEYAISKYYWYAKILQVVERSSKVQRLVISRSLK
jgi:butyryl-CoA dehydrogenase